MRLHGLLADAEDLSDLFVRLPLGQQSQHVGLALRERLRAFGGPDLPHQARGGFRRELHLTGRCGLDRPPQLVGLGVLQQIPNRAGPDRADDRRILQDAGQGQDFGIRERSPDLLRRGDAVHSGHQQVHQHDIRLELARQANSLRPVGRLSHDFQIGIQRQEHPQALADHAVVVGDQNPGHHRVHLRL